MKHDIQHPNRQMPVRDLCLADIVKAFDGQWGTAIVKEITDEEVIFFRPYGTTSDFSVNNYVLCYVGFEHFSVRKDSSQTFFVYRRKELQ